MSTTTIDTNKSKISILNLVPGYDAERDIDLCEPCIFSIEVLVPYELDSFRYRGIEAEIWTNACDIVSSTGRWHEIPSEKISLKKSPLGRVHQFTACVLPIMCGHFEYTVRARAPKSGNTDWTWGENFQKNGKINVTRNPEENTFGLTRDIRQFWQWFEDCEHTISLQPHASPLTSPLGMCDFDSTADQVIAYVSAYMATNALQNGVSLDSCRILLPRLCTNNWIRSRGNLRRLLVLFTGSCLRANLLERKLKDIPYNECTSHHSFSFSSPSSIDSHICKCIPSILLKLALLTDNNKKRSVPNDVIFDLLLSYIKNSPTDEIDSNLPFDLIQLLIQSDDVMLYMYISRLLRVLYEKSNIIINKHKNIYMSNYVVYAIIETLNLYSVLVTENACALREREVDDAIYTEGQQGPLHLLIKFIRSLYVDKSSRMHTSLSENSKGYDALRKTYPSDQSDSNKLHNSFSCNNFYNYTRPSSSCNGNNNNNGPSLCIHASLSRSFSSSRLSSLNPSSDIHERETANVSVIFESLLELFLKMKEDHPDYNDMSTLIYEFCQIDVYIRIYMIKRILKCKEKGSDETIQLMKLFDRVIRMDNELLYVDQTFKIRIVSYYLKLFHSPHVIVSLTALTLIEYSASSPFWILLAGVPTKYSQRFVEYLDEGMNHWTPIYINSIHKYKEDLKDKGILINGELDISFLVQSENDCMRQSTITSSPLLTALNMAESENQNNSQGEFLDVKCLSPSSPYDGNLSFL